MSSFESKVSTPTAKHDGTSPSMAYVPDISRVFARTFAEKCIEKPTGEIGMDSKGLMFRDRRRHKWAASVTPLWGAPARSDYQFELVRQASAKSQNSFTCIFASDGHSPLRARRKHPKRSWPQQLEHRLHPFQLGSFQAFSSLRLFGQTSTVV